MIKPIPVWATPTSEAQALVMNMLQGLLQDPRVLEDFYMENDRKKVRKAIVKIHNDISKKFDGDSLILE